MPAMITSDLPSFGQRFPIIFMNRMQPTADAMLFPSLTGVSHPGCLGSYKVSVGIGCPDNALGFGQDRFITSHRCP